MGPQGEQDNRPFLNVSIFPDHKLELTYYVGKMHKRGTL